MLAHNSFVRKIMVLSLLLTCCLGVVDKSFANDKDSSTQSRCDQLRRERAESHRKKIEVCKSNKVSATNSVTDKKSECIERVERCNQMNSSEAAVDFATQMMMGLAGIQMPLSQYANQCNPITPEESRALRSKEERLKDRVERIEKDILEVQEGAERQKRLIDKAIKELNKRAREDDLKMKEAERKEIADYQKAQIDSQRKIRELQRNILNMQSASAKIVTERARALGRLTNAAIQRNCNESLQVEIDKQLANNPALRRKLTRSANSLIAQNSTRRQSWQEKLKQCVQDLQRVREETRIEFQGRLDDIQHQIASAQKEIAEIESAMKLVESQRSQAQAEQQQNKVQIMQERMGELMSLQQELQSNTQMTQQKIMQMQQQLQKTKLDLATASNELATVDQRPDGKFDISEALHYEEEIKRIEGELKRISCPGFEESSSGQQNSTEGLW
jgi:chromosome segregation ATPase